MEDYEMGTICYKRVKRHDASSSVWLQSSRTLVTSYQLPAADSSSLEDCQRVKRHHASGFSFRETWITSSQLPAADSSSLEDDFDCKVWQDIRRYYKLKQSCYLRKHALQMFDTCWKSVIPSLALWCHMKLLKFDFKDLMSKFRRGLDKLAIVKEALKEQCRVNLQLYDIWSEESKEFLSSEDHQTKLVRSPLKFGGKLVDETPDGTTIYIGRRFFAILVKELLVEIDRFATIRKWSNDAYNLLNDSMTMVDSLDYWNNQHLCDIRPPFRDILIHMKNVMEPKYHWFIRKEQEDTLKHVWAYHTMKEKLRALKTFPFHMFRGYSERIRELFETKVAGSQPYRTTKDIIEHYREFMSSPHDIKKFTSESGGASFTSLSGYSGDLLRQMCTKSSEEFKKVQDCVNFSNAMVRFFEITVNDKPLREKLESDIAPLSKSQGWLSKDGNLEEFRTSLEAFRGRWMNFFHNLSLDYVVLGILLYRDLYRDGAAVTGDQLKKFISQKVELPMMAKRSYLLQIWQDSFYDEKVCLDLADPARVLSSCFDDKIEFPKCEEHDVRLLSLQLEEDRLEKQRSLVPAKALESGFRVPSESDEESEDDS